MIAFHGGRAMLRAGFARVSGHGESEVDREYPKLLYHYETHIDRETRMYPGAVAAVEALRAGGYRVGICTNKPAGLAETLMTRLGVRGLFHSLVGADTLPVRKPDPAPYRLAVERAGGAVDRSFLVGDTETDMATARAAGVPCALVGFGPEGAAIGRLAPVALLSHYDDLPALAVRLLGQGARSG